MAQTYTEVGEDFRLADELLLVISDTGDVEPLAQAFFRTEAGTIEWGPLPVTEILAMADADSLSSGRPVVIRLEGEAAWDPGWGTLLPA
jgi:hypothetical protein